jgi:D-glycero-alpha-D-manno-heptose 1-phosphate guanylyltransferase
MKREAVILAGGFGTRLKSVVNDIPKPMALINGKPFLLYLIEQLGKFRFEKVIIAAGYKYEAIKTYFGSSYKNIKLTYSVEKEPLGTGGAIYMASGLTTSDCFFILNGDTFFEVDFDKMEGQFIENNSDLMVALKPMVGFDRYGAVVTNNKKILSFCEKKYCDNGLINGGIYLLKTDWLQKRAPGKVFSFEKDILEKYAERGEITSYISDGYFIDIGIPEDYKKAAEELPLFHPLTT